MNWGQESGTNRPLTLTRLLLRVVVVVSASFLITTATTSRVLRTSIEKDQDGHSTGPVRRRRLGRGDNTGEKMIEDLCSQV